MGGIEVELLPSLVAGRDDLDHERRCGQVHRVGAGADEPPVRDAVVALPPEIELSRRTLAPRWPPAAQGSRPVAIRAAVPAVRCGVHVQHTLPHLVEQILAEATAPLKQRLEFHRLRVTYERRHVLKATAGPGAPIPIAHGSLIVDAGGRPPLIRRSAPISPTCPTACASWARHAGSR